MSFFSFLFMVNAQALTFEVNLVDDLHDMNPGDGVCDAVVNDGLQCTLRAAIEEANAFAGDDVIHLESGQTYLSQLGLFSIDDFSGGNLYLLTENGAPAEITLPDLDKESWRLFDVGGRLEMENIIIRDIDRGDQLGTALNGSGIVNIRNSIFSGNFVAVSEVSGNISNTVFSNNSTGVAAGFGGASLVVTDSLFDGNKIAATVGDGSLQLERVIIENTPEQPTGSAVINSYGVLTITDSEIRNNAARGLYINCTRELVGDSAGTKTIVINTLISNNEVTNDNGGGVWIKGNPALSDPPQPECKSTAWIINSTISGNRAYKTGGGIKTWGEAGATIHLHNVTLVNNLANTGGFLGYKGGGLDNQNSHTIVIRNSIIANNHFRFNGELNESDCIGSIQSENYNFIQNPQVDCSITGNTSNDQSGIDPLLEELQNNGGLTLTHALTENSPAIDSGNPAGCQTDLDTFLPFTDTNLLTDQRAAPRPLDGDGNGSIICDPGAFEYKYVKPVTNEIFGDSFED